MEHMFLKGRNSMLDTRRLCADYAERHDDVVLTSQIFTDGALGMSHCGSGFATFSPR